LVDGGKDSGKIVKLLKQQLPQRHIDALICTHYDADHYAGLRRIITSRKFQVNELWLPDILGTIAYSICKSYRTGIEALAALRNDGQFQQLQQDAQYPVVEAPLVGDEEYEETMSREWIDEEHIRHFQLFFHTINISGNMAPIARTLYKIPELLRQVAAGGTYVRWFRFRDGDAIGRVSGSPVPVKAVNCRQHAVQFVTDPRVILRLATFAAALSTNNKYSHNFLFEYDSLPHIFFTGDSNLGYRKEAVALRNGSLVTGPHYGAASCAGAHEMIVGDQLSYIRSDQSQQERPCQEYVALPEKYCTICRSKTIKKEVKFLYDRELDKYVTDHNSCC
jgi:ribonuclease BN (tRNA processing enzyme)